MTRAMLAFWFGIHGAMTSLNICMSKEFTTIVTKDNGSPGDCGYVMRFERNSLFMHATMLAAAVEVDE